MKKFFRLSSIILLGLCIVVFSHCATRAKKLSKSPTVNHVENRENMNSDELLPTFGGPNGVRRAIRPIVIYKTRKDYQRFVPVQLSEDKKQVVSYPGRSDVYYGKNLATPIELGEGYLMDRRGITENSAFLDITYQEYTQLSEDPDASFIMAHIMDTDPLIYLAVIDARVVDANDLEKIALLVMGGSPEVSVILDKRATVD